MSGPILLLAIVGGLALLVLLAGFVDTVSNRRSVVDERMGRYASGGGPASDSRPISATGPRPSPVGELLNRILAGRGFASGIQTQLARADLKLNVGEYFALVAISIVGTGAIFSLLARTLYFGIAGAILGFFLPRFYIGARQGARLKAFDNQLADMLNLVVNGLRAGYSSMQALESVGKEMPSPISVEFKRVVQEMQLGIAMEAALANLLRRINSPDLDLVVTAINVQREVGGNLADILETISHTIRERVRIKGEIRVITSQQRFSAYLLSAMPFALAGVLFLVNRPYLKQFVDPPSNRVLGIPMLIIGLVLITVGIFVMQKIVDIDV